MGWSGEQIQNAATIYQVGKQMGMSTRDIQIGLMAAMVESNLVNVAYGDRDSLGLFQQRASWGSADQRLDPQYAAKKFFASLRSLGDRRNQMNMGAAAQAVQRSAYPGRYIQRLGDVRGLWPRIANAAGDPQTDVDGKPYGSTQSRLSQQNPLSFGTPSDDPIQPSDLLGAPTDESDLSDLLGAWDTATPQALDGASGPNTQSPRTILSPGTNEAVIKPLAETQGGYGKGVNGWRKAVIQTAEQYLGTPYAWGGTTPTDGFDCSGLIQYVFGKAGKKMPRISYQQANSGKRVALNKLRPGDLVAWDNSTRNNGADHIALYIGHGQIIEAPRPGTSVRIRSLGSNEGAWGVSLG